MPLSSKMSMAVCGLSTAINIAKTLEADKLIEKTDLKLHIVGLLSALADTKLAIVGIQDEFRNRNEEIIRLKNDLKLSKNVIRDDSFHYEANENKEPVGNAYCSLCFEKDAKTIYMVQDPLDKKIAICPNCMVIKRIYT